MPGIFIGSLIFVVGLSMLNPIVLQKGVLVPIAGFSPLAWIVCASGLTIALTATARYAVELMANFVAVKPSAKRTIYDDIGHDEIASDPASR